MESEREILQVACAIIVRGGKILAAQRPKYKDQGGKWEFPGGKLHPEEMPGDCIVREIIEELGVRIVLKEQLPTVVHNYPDKTVALIPFLAVMENEEEPHPYEHEQIAWFFPHEFDQFDWSDADKCIMGNFLLRQA
ncbi:MAG: NUDIX domain-containing protein [Breznakibacter sp.]